MIRPRVSSGGLLGLLGAARGARDASAGDGNSLPNGDSGSHPGPPIDASFACDGCAPFPPGGTPECPPNVLDKPKIAYPTDGLLLPPNMNVLEVQRVPPAGATLFDVEFTNAITGVRVETMCTPVPDVRGGASK